MLLWFSTYTNRLQDEKPSTQECVNMMAAARYMVGKLLSIRYERIWFVCFTRRTEKFYTRSNEGWGIVIYKNALISLFDLLHIYLCTHCLTDKTPSGVSYHTSGCYTSAYHGGVPGSRSRQSVWDLSWTQLQWDRLYSEYFGFVEKVIVPPCSISFHCYTGNGRGTHYAQFHQTIQEKNYIYYIHIYQNSKLM